MDPCNRNASLSTTYISQEDGSKEIIGGAAPTRDPLFQELEDREALKNASSPEASLLQVDEPSRWGGWGSYLISFIPSWSSGAIPIQNEMSEEVRETDRQDAALQKRTEEEGVEEMLLYDHTMKREKKYLRVGFSLAGGGANGQSQAIVLKKIESALGKPIGEVIDQLSGTSAGGISGSLLLIKDGDNWRHPAKELAEKLKTIFPAVFHRGPIYSVTSFNGYGTKAKYPDDGLNRTLKEWYGDLRLSQLAKDFMAPVVCFQEVANKPKEKSVKIYEFSRDKAVRKPDRDLLLREVMRAVPAAESYFTPFRATLDDQEFALADGGLYENYPLTACYFEGNRLFNCGKDMILCYVGTGERHKTVADSSLNGGAASYIRSIAGINAVCTELAEIHKVQKLLKENLFVFNPDVTRVALDETRSKEIDRLEEETEVWLKKESVRKSIEEMADKIEENYQRRPQS